jgi:hypothetical protein
MRLRFETTNSETSTFLKCTKRWFFEYYSKLRPKKKSWHLDFGAIIHAGIEEGYRCFPTFSSSLDFVDLEAIKNVSIKMAHNKAKMLFDDSLELSKNNPYIETEEIKNEYIKSCELSKSMLCLYWDCSVDDFDCFIPIFIEKSFCVPVLNSVGKKSHLYHKGVFDLVVYDCHWKDLVLIDHKTMEANVMTVEKRFEFDPQISGYLYALKWLLNQEKIINPLTKKPFDKKTPVGRIHYNALRKKIPSKPLWLKNGSVSSKMIDTLPKIYEDALQEQCMIKNIPIKEKQDKLLKILQEKGHKSFYCRFEYYKPQKEIDIWVNEQYSTTRRMRKLYKKPFLSVRTSEACTMAWSPSCPYRMVCIDDTLEIRELYYRIAEKRHEEIIL